MSSRKRRGGNASEVRGPPFWGPVYSLEHAKSILDCLEQEVVCSPATVSVATGIRARMAVSDAAIC